MNRFDLDTPLLKLAIGDAFSEWTIRHAVEGVQIFGGIGSGKSSGSGRQLALKYLEAGFGGLVLTVKPDEKKEWEEYCRLAGRQNDLIVIEPDNLHCFNFLDYEAATAAKGRALTENLVDLLKTVIRAGQSQDQGKGDDSFWEGALDMMIFNVIDLCQLAYGKVSIERMYEIVQTVPKPGEKVITRQEELEALRKEEAAQFKADGIKRPKRELNPFEEAMVKAHIKVNERLQAWYDARDPDEVNQAQQGKAYKEWLEENFPEARLYNFVRQFFLKSYRNLTEKTRSIIDFIFLGFLYRMLREPVYSLFCRGTSTFSPEDCLNGKIILLNLPVKTYFKVGRDCQILFKYIWQRAMEKRQVEVNARPVFLWADEAQNFLHEHDAVYQATARSSRISTVYITQNLPNYYASMGGALSQYRVKSFLGTLATKIFHANADIETNHYASDLIGDDYFENLQKGEQYGNDFSMSNSRSMILEKQVRPEEFISLKTGGPRNGFIVEGCFHRQGDTLFNGDNHILMRFNQLYKPVKNNL